MTEEEQLTQGGLVDDVQAVQSDDAPVDKEQPTEENPQDKEKENQEEKTDEQKQKEVNEFVGLPQDGYTNDNIQLPDGMTLDENMLGEFTDFAKKVNMSQKAYDKSVTYGVKLVEQAQQQFVTALQKQQEQQILNYQREAFADKDIGGENYNASLTTAKLAYRQFVSPELDTVLQQSGLQYHKDLIKMFKSVGEMMQNDTLKGGKNPQGNTGNKAEEIADRMFSSMSQ